MGSVPVIVLHRVLDMVEVQVENTEVKIPCCLHPSRTFLFVITCYLEALTSETQQNLAYLIILACHFLF